MPVTLQNQNVTWNSDTLSATQLKTFPLVASVGASAPTTTVQTSVFFPWRFKIRKVSVSGTAIDSITSGDAFNLVVGGFAGQTAQAYNQGNPAPNDNSMVSSSIIPTGTSGGLGYPTNFAAAGQTVFAADVPFTFAGGGTYATGYNTATGAMNTGSGWITLTTAGFAGIFIPTNYDAVYLETLPISLRVSTVATTGSLTNLQVVLSVIPFPLRKGENPTELTACIPGQDQ